MKAILVTVIACILAYLGHLFIIKIYQKALVHTCPLLAKPTKKDSTNEKLP